MVINLTDLEALQLSAFLKNVMEQLENKLKLNNEFNQALLIDTIDQFIMQVSSRLSEEDMKKILEELKQLEKRYNESKNN
jgi:anion-transporting  ArsA/GET3 family ATPase